MVDFLKDASNVYSTAKYIVAQKISVVTNEQNQQFITTLDTFYPRTKIRDKQYALAFVTDKVVTGGRVNCDVTKRKYVE